MGDVFILPDHSGGGLFTGGWHQKLGVIDLINYGILSYHFILTMQA